MTGGTKEQRETYALKLSRLDGMDKRDVRERVNDRFDGNLTLRTIENYLNGETAGEIDELIANEQANVREQIADREEMMRRRARQAEREATRDKPVIGFTPKTKTNNRKEDLKRVRAWEVLEPGDEKYPEWADPSLDVIIDFTDGSKLINPGGIYPVADLLGNPEYRKTVVGIERDVPDPGEKRRFRYEQSEHLANRGRAVGVYTDVQIDGELDLNIDGDIELSNDTLAELREQDLAAMGSDGMGPSIDPPADD